MSITLQSAATGLSALNTRMDVIANNLANVNTTGYKKSRANFQDLLYVERQQPGVENANGDQRPIGLYVGLGVKVSGTHLNFEQGAPVTTERALDLLIDGQGFFQVTVDPDLGDGVGYTRAGNFSLNSEGDIVLANDEGRLLEPNINVPEDIDGPITVRRDGTVFARTAGDTAAQEIGQIELALFVNPAGLRQIGENLYVETDASGPPIVGEPGLDGRGRIEQGMLEQSNVDPTRELIELIRTQRAFEMNSQAIRAADEALRTIAQLRR